MACGQCKGIGCSNSPTLEELDDMDMVDIPSLLLTAMPAWTVLDLVRSHCSAALCWGTLRVSRISLVFTGKAVYFSGLKDEALNDVRIFHFFAALCFKH